MQKWEYQYAVIKNITSNRATLEHPLIDGTKRNLKEHQHIDWFLNWMGEQGWEICGTYSNQTENAYVVDVALLFKRPRE